MTYTKPCLNCNQPTLPHWKYCDRKDCAKEVKRAYWRKAYARKKLSTHTTSKKR